MEREDLAEVLRYAELIETNANPGSREALEAQHGKVWTVNELSQEFEVLQFSAPFVVCRRKADGKLGSVQFQHNPRFYFNWVEDNA
jgi:hypothetical protein